MRTMAKKLNGYENANCAVTSKCSTNQTVCKGATLCLDYSLGFFQTVPLGASWELFKQHLAWLAGHKLAVVASLSGHTQILNSILPVLQRNSYVDRIFICLQN